MMRNDGIEIHKKYLPTKDRVVVRVFNFIHADELVDLITKQLNEGYYIQDSHVENYQGTVDGVYVFVLKEDLKNDV